MAAPTLAPSRRPAPAAAPPRRITRRALAAAALAATVAGTAAWAAAPDPHRPMPGIPGQARWAANVTAAAPGRPAPEINDPDAVRAFFHRLTPTQERALADRAPRTVANLDGAPLALRYRLNAGPAPGGGRLLALDPRGDGRAVEVFGDLAAARRIAVLVPGAGWNLHQLLDHGDRRPDGPVTMARNLRAAMDRTAPGTPSAVVVWLGYDTPEGIDRESARSGRAEDGAPALARFTRALPDHAGVTLVCHSYGSVVCGRALPEGARADDVVALSSPGMDAGSAAGLHTRARIWAARAADDPMRFVPYVRALGYGHGADPVGRGFGARVFGTGSATGHAGYLAAGTESLANLARIATGETSSVTG